MKLKTLAGALALAFTALAPVANATTITNKDGTFQWGGFDWDSQGTAFTTGFQPVANDPFGLTFFASATSLKDPAGFNLENFQVPNLDTTPNGSNGGNPNAYEYTVVASLNEQVISCNATTCDFKVVSGSYTIYYDTSANANRNTGTGFGDGVAIITGTFAPQFSGTFTVTGSGGAGVTTLQGGVSTTNLAYVNPALTNTTVGTTLQLGSAQTNGWTAPSGFNGSPLPGSPDIIFQADANQSFATVPEPASLGLVAAALLAGGLATRRSSKK